MTNTDPITFDPEVTGSFSIKTLAGNPIQPAEQPPGEAPAPAFPGQDAPPYGYRGCSPFGEQAPNAFAPPEYIPPTFSPAPVSLTYAWSDGRTLTRVDVDNGLTNRGDESDIAHRERLLLRALLTHALAVLNGEDLS